MKKVFQKKLFKKVFMTISTNKRVSLFAVVLVLSFLIVGYVRAVLNAPSGLTTTGSTINVSEYLDLTNAVSLIGSEKVDLLIDNETVITADTTVPANINLIVSARGLINRNGHNLVINGGLSAGLQNVFTGSGNVTGLKEIHPEWWGAKADNSTDCGPGFQAGLDSLSAGGRMSLSPGTYLFSSFRSIPGEGVFYLVKMRSDVTVEGPRSAILKVADGMRAQSTGGIALLYSNNLDADLIKNSVWRGFSVDWNGQNNPNPGNAKNTNRMGADYAQNCTIDGVYFKNATGHHNVLFGGHTDSQGVSRSYKNRVINCVIENVADTIAEGDLDHSAIFIYGPDSIATGNVITNESLSTVATAIEFGGNSSIVADNTIRNYATGINYVAMTQDTKDVQIVNNNILDVIRGIVIWHGKKYSGDTKLTVDAALRSGNIEGNTIRISDDATPGQNFIRGGIHHYGGYFVPKDVNRKDEHGNPDPEGDVYNTEFPGDDIKIHNNTIYADAHANSYMQNGIYIDMINDLSITDNTIYGLKNEAIILGEQNYSKQKGFLQTKIKNNKIRYCQLGYGSGIRNSFIFLFGGYDLNTALSGMEITNNSFQNDAGLSLFAIRSNTNWITNITIRDNTYTGFSFSSGDSGQSAGPISRSKSSNNNNEVWNINETISSVGSPFNSHCVGSVGSSISDPYNQKTYFADRIAFANGSGAWRVEGISATPPTTGIVGDHYTASPPIFNSGKTTTGWIFTGTDTVQPLVVPNN